ncbi:MAG: hypothetical protein KDG56_08200, partial [Ottowia sp.]|nr:hypothetical protein [Ottowia sp.]
AKGHGKWGRLSFAYFSLAKQRKVGALPGAHPGLRRDQNITLSIAACARQIWAEHRFHSRNNSHQR